MKKKIVIIGSGHAGGMLCSNLIKEDFDADITIIGNEAFLPYARPELSKGLLEGTIDEKRIYLKSNDFYKKNGVNLINNTYVNSIKREEQTIVTNDDYEISYDYLVFATGSSLIKFKSSCDEKKLFYLRTLSQSKDIKKLLNRKKLNLGIIGSGYIGLEIASIAAKKNHKVSIFDSEERVLARSTCSDISDFIKDKHKKNGVNFFLKTKIIDIEDHKTFKKIICDDGVEISVDEVIVGIGVKPNISLALEAGLNCDNGIVVDEDCRTSDDKIFAIGDCTYSKDLFYEKFLRIESVHNAITQSKIASAAIADQNRPNYETPWFWTNQYDLRIFFTGISNNYDEKITIGSIEKESFSICYFNNQRLIAVDSINRNRDYMQAKKIISNGSHRNKELLDLEHISLKDMFF